MYTAPELWDELMTRLAGIVATYLRLQAEAGVHALQVFDSWVGTLSLDDYRRYVQPAMARLFASLSNLGVPLIHFGTGTTALLEGMRDAGGDVIGLDWRIPLDLAWERVGFDRGVQGNLDPAVLLAPWPVVERQASAILRRAGSRPGHIFNLGHGVLPQTEVQTLARLVEHVHGWTG